MLNADRDLPAMPETCLEKAIPGAISLARTLAAALEAHPRVRTCLDLRLARALTLDVIDILGRIDELSTEWGPATTK